MASSIKILYFMLQKLKCVLIVILVSLKSFYVVQMTVLFYTCKFNVKII